MISALSPTEEQIFTVLTSFLRAVLPGIKTVRGQANRVPEPKDSNFVVMWPLRRPRLATNIDSYTDCVFTASITDDVMNVTAVDLTYSGMIAVGSTVFGVNLPEAGIVVESFGTGTGGIGTYNMSASPDVSSQTMSAGIETLQQNADFTVQLDVHGPLSGNNATTISTVLRDNKGVGIFVAAVAAASLPDGCITPLYADDPRQMPFENDQQQYETRYIIEAHLQVNQSLSLPQDFADQISATILAPL